jgi:hypothetical protein
MGAFEYASVFVTLLLLRPSATLPLVRAGGILVLLFGAIGASSLRLALAIAGKWLLNDELAGCCCCYCLQVPSQYVAAIKVKLVGVIALI